MTIKPLFLVVLSAILFIFTGAACAGGASGPQAWIDHPINGASLPPDTPMVVVSHAFSTSKLVNFKLSVNGADYRIDPTDRPGQTFGSARQEWRPSGEGNFTLQVTAFGEDGSSVRSAPVVVQIRRAVALAVTPLEITPTVASLPDLAIVQVEAVQQGVKDGVPFCNPHIVYTNQGSLAVPADFTIQLHFNGTPAVANTVAGGLPPGSNAEITFSYQYVGQPYIGVNLDSTNLINEADESNNAFAEIRMCGTPVTITPTLRPSITPTLRPSVTPNTPAPPSDTTPPPPPIPAVPADGLSIACKANQNLVWQPSNDPSGIAKYELRLERRPNPGASWKLVDEWNNLHDKQHSVAVECGYEYRWRVRAVDGAGNTGNWSAWSTFSVQLT